MMTLATGNQAFSSSCHFETRVLVSSSHLATSSPAATATTVIDQPAWFKPKSFHTFATWIIVALEENLWAHYNSDNNANLGSGTKANDLQLLFRERSDQGAQDVDLCHLGAFWKDTPDKDKRALIDVFRNTIIKDFSQLQFENSQQQEQSGGISKSSKVVQSKSVAYSLSIKEKGQESRRQAEAAELEVKALIEVALKAGAERDLIDRLVYTPFSRSSHRSVSVTRKFLDLIKKKYKDDLMENLLQEEEQQFSKASPSLGTPSLSTSLLKAFKKKKKKQQQPSATTIDNNEPGIEATTAASSLENTAIIEANVENKKSASKKKKVVKAIPEVTIASKTAKSKKKKSNNEKIEKVLQEEIVKDSSTSEIQNDTHVILEQSNASSTETTKSSEPQTQASSSSYENSNRGETETPPSIQTLQASKSVDLKIPQQTYIFSNNKKKTNKVVESKNLQIQQYSKIKLMAAKSIPHVSAEQPDTIFSDDSLDNTDSNNVMIVGPDSVIIEKDTSDKNVSRDTSSENIQTYVVELTNLMIAEVCRRMESLSPVSSRATKVIESSPLNLSSLAPANHSSDQTNNKMPTRLSQESKLFPEVTPPSSRRISLENDEPQRKYSNNAPTQQRRDFGILLNKGEERVAPQPRKDSGINSQLKPVDSESAWAKGTARQIAEAAAIKKKTVVPSERKLTSETIDLLPPVKTNNIVKAVKKVPEVDAAAKKKRNKKKSKLTDTDLMNNFMKSLHSHADEQEQKQTKKRPDQNAPSTQHPKKDHNKTIVAVSVVQQQLPETVIEEESKMTVSKDGQVKVKTVNKGARKDTVKSQVIRGSQHRRYTEDELISSQPLNHQQNHEECTQSLDGNLNEGKEQKVNSRQSNQSKNHIRSIKKSTFPQTGAQPIESIPNFVPTDQKAFPIIILEVNEDHRPNVESTDKLSAPQIKMIDTPVVPRMPEIQMMNGGLNLHSAPFKMSFAPQVIQSEPEQDNSTISGGDLARGANDNTSLSSHHSTPQKSRNVQEIPNFNPSLDSNSSSIQSSYRTPPQNSKKQQIGQFNYSTATQSNFVPTCFDNATYLQQQPNPYHLTLASSLSASGQPGQRLLPQDLFQPTTTSSFEQQQQQYPTLQSTFGGHQFFMPTYTTENNNTFGLTSPPPSSNMMQQQKQQFKGQYPGGVQRRTVQSARNLNNNVYMQPMNISQSMQEQQQQFMHTYINNNNQDNNIFYQDQSNSNVSPPNTGIYESFVNNPVATQPKGLMHNQSAEQPVFPYIEKQLGGVEPCYSPAVVSMTQPHQIQQLHHNSSYNNNCLQSEVAPNPFSYQRASASQQYFDQSQDLIFQIFNSIKSNHSMSPIPQLMSPPPHLEFQMSSPQENNWSQNGNQPQRMDSAQFNVQEVQFYEKFDQDIADYVKTLHENIALLKPERDCVLAKIAEIAQKTFVGESPRIEIFGSLVTGLALESSDMDLAVTGLHIDDRQVMIADLNSLAHALEPWLCLNSFKSIDTASIPVIKMKVDLEKLRQLEMTETEEGDFVRRPISENQRYLAIDITFDDSSTYHSSSHSTPSLQSLMLMSPGEFLDQTMQTKTHLGLQSCALVQYYLAHYRNLKQVAILLKRFLAIHDFNSPYYGGLSSYSAVILIVAYMNYYGLKQNNQPTGNQLDDMSPARLLMGFLDFFGNYFNPGSMGISVYEDGSFFQLQSQHHLITSSDSNFVILDPLNLQNNTTKNSYQTKDILTRFQCAFNNLKTLMHKLPQQQQQQEAVLSSQQQAACSKVNSQVQKSSVITIDQYLGKDVVAGDPNLVQQKNDCYD